MNTERFWLGPVPIDPVSREGALEAICALVAAGQGGTVFTPNVDHVVLADRQASFRDAYARVSLSLVDGVPVVVGARLLGRPVPEKISGSDLLVPLLVRAAECKWSVGLLGGAPGVADGLAATLPGRFPGLKIPVALAPPIDMSQPPELRRELFIRLTAVQPHLVLVALGSPKGELLADEARTALAPAVIVCIGAGLDFLAGAQRRAPAWMSRCGLEWLYRLLHEPRRLWRRYLVRGPAFFPILARAILAQRRGASKGA